MATVSSEDSSVQALLGDSLLCAQSPMHLSESVAPSGSSRLQSSINFGSIN